MAIHFRKALLFCTNPLPGCFRYADYFQIYPWDSPAAPKSDKEKLFPVALEYFFVDSAMLPVPKDFEEIKSYLSREAHSNNKQKQILHLISSITNYRFCTHAVWDNILVILQYPFHNPTKTYNNNTNPR